MLLLHKLNILAISIENSEFQIILLVSSMEKLMFSKVKKLKFYISSFNFYFLQNFLKPYATIENTILIPPHTSETLEV